MNLLVGIGNELRRRRTRLSPSFFSTTIFLLLPDWLAQGAGEYVGAMRGRKNSVSRMRGMDDSYYLMKGRRTRFTKVREFSTPSQYLRQWKQTKNNASVPSLPEFACQLETATIVFVATFFFHTTTATITIATTF